MIEQQSVMLEGWFFGMTLGFNNNLSAPDGFVNISSQKWVTVWVKYMQIFVPNFAIRFLQFHTFIFVWFLWKKENNNNNYYISAKNQSNF